MKRFMILSALFVSALFIASCGEEKKQTYEENLKKRNFFYSVDKEKDSLLYNAAVEHFGKGFDYKLENVIAYREPYEEKIDTMYVYFDKLVQKNDTFYKSSAETNDQYPKFYKFIKKLERTEKTYVDTTDFVCFITAVNKVFDNIKKETKESYLSFFALIKDNDVSIYEGSIAKRANFSFYKKEYEYKEIK